MRIGHGMDIHRLIPQKKLVLGGVIIPSEKGEDGHSDGDVLIHALIDAIFGATANGDIGSHYPPSDNKYKNIDSILLLKDALLIANCKIYNVDSTIILERPKLREHIDAIRESLSKLLNLDLSLISVKAKTAEGILGELGAGDAIAAEVVILID
ncbi:MAG: 2-C-methyl-D-erythritol 2,4-cyclodiphosphate synthase [Spirochaetales bacterium]|nr:2-C-methyl-D-erythritol 2,4-cyclodiphosphate synthase [Spirochaetales bacterium]